MTDTTTIPLAAPGGALSLPARIIGVFFAPRATYADVAARPRWAGMLAVVVLVGSMGTFAFLSTEVGRQAMLDQQIRAMESFGFKVSDAQYARMEQSLGFARYTGPIFQAISLPLIGLGIAGLMIGLFNAILGGNAAFKQVYAIVVHSGIIMTLAQIFGLPLAYARESMSSSTNLAVFFPFLDDASFAARFLGSIDLFVIWWIVSLSIGLGVLYRRKTGPIANGLIGAYVVIGLIIAVVKTALSGA
jgi:hypothetical protein